MAGQRLPVRRITQPSSMLPLPPVPRSLNSAFGDACTILMRDQSAPSSSARIMASDVRTPCPIRFADCRRDRAIEVDADPAIRPERRRRLFVRAKNALAVETNNERRTTERGRFQKCAARRHHDVFSCINAAARRIAFRIRGSFRNDRPNPTWPRRSPHRSGPDDQRKRLQRSGSFPADRSRDCATSSSSQAR